MTSFSFYGRDENGKIRWNKIIASGFLWISAGSIYMIIFTGVLTRVGISEFAFNIIINAGLTSLIISFGIYLVIASLLILWQYGDKEPEKKLT